MTPPDRAGFAGRWGTWTSIPTGNHGELIEHAEHRARAIDIGQRLEVLKDYPTPPNCTSPYAPVWIAEMVRRQHDN